MQTIYPINQSDINGIIHKTPSLQVLCTASSTASAQFQCSNAINPMAKYHFCSYNQNSNEWFQVQFYNRIIYIQNYSIQVPNQKENVYWYVPNSLELFGITSKGEMISIDNQTDTKLTGAYKVVTYKIAKPGYYSGVRFSMRGRNCGNLKELRLHKIDDLESCKI